jgi:Spy/CpxP family protein refolding chaperone
MKIIHKLLIAAVAAGALLTAGFASAQEAAPAPVHHGHHHKHHGHHHKGHHHGKHHEAAHHENSVGHGNDFDHLNR